MTDFFDAGQTITSLGTGEALVTVLSPRGVPTPLAPTRLVPPDSLMAAIPPDEMQRRIVAGSLYGDVRRDDRPRERPRDPLGAPGRREGRHGGRHRSPPARALRPRPRNGGAIEARARELERIRRDAEREAQARPSASGTRQEAAIAGRRSAPRSASRTSIQDVGGDLLRGVFGTLFGGGAPPPLKGGTAAALDHLGPRHACRRRG